MACYLAEYYVASWEEAEWPPVQSLEASPSREPSTNSVLIQIASFARNTSPIHTMAIYVNVSTVAYTTVVDIIVYTLVAAITLCWRRLYISHIHHFHYIYTTLLKMASHIHHFAKNGVTYTPLCLKWRRLAYILYESWLLGVFRVTMFYILYINLCI